MKISKTIKLADFLTIGNFACGLLSIMYSMKQEYQAAAVLIAAAVVLDFLDGRVARATGTVNDFGKHLDSLADLISFGVAPALFGYALGLQSGIAVAILAYFSICGMLRLARFNIQKQKGFIGVPITINGILFPAIYFLLGGFSNYILWIYFVMGLLMISTINIKKI